MAKRRFKKKKARSFRRRRRMSRRPRTAPRYDGGVRVKFKQYQEYFSDGAAGTYMTINWGDQFTGVINANTISLNSCAEWTRYSNLYRYFQVRGVKIKWLPADQNGRAYKIGSLNYAGSPVGNIMNTIPQMQLAIDYQMA